MEPVIELVGLGLATGTTAVLVTKSTLFRPVREWLHESGDVGIFGVDQFLAFAEELVDCYYCVSFWIALAIYLAFQPMVLNTAFQVPYLSEFITGVVHWLMVSALGQLTASVILRGAANDE